MGRERGLPLAGGKSPKSMYSPAQILCRSLVGRAGKAELMEVMALYSGSNDSVLAPRASSRALLIIFESPSEGP